MRIVAIVVAIACCVAAFLYLLRDLPPPDRLAFAAGPRDGGYWNVALRYRQLLARDGITLEILETAGSVENARLLGERRADVGLLQGGVRAPDEGVEALGTVFTEPVLFLARRDRNLPANLGDWQGLRIAAGEPGSGTRAATSGLFATLGLGPPRNELVGLGGAEAGAALIQGAVDAVVYVTTLQAPYLRDLLAEPSVGLVSLDHIDGVSVRLPFSRVVEVPSGAVALSPPVPPRPVRLLSLQARLAAVDDLHPAVVDRLVAAAREIHGRRGIFALDGQYPSPDGVDMPIDAGALKLLLEGQSAFHGWLPYWVAAQIRQVLLVLVPLLFLVVPLVRALPFAYGWTMRRRVWRHYRKIREIEMALANAGSRAELEALDTRLRGIDRRLGAMALPPAFRDRAFDARLHLELVRRQIADRLAAAGAAEVTERHGDVAPARDHDVAARLDRPS